MDPSSISPELLQQLSEMLSQQDEVGDTNSDTDYQHLLQRSMRNPLQGHRAGNTYVSSSPLEGLANMAMAYVTHKKEGSNDATVRGLRENLNRTRYGAMREAAGLPPDPYDANGVRLPGPNQQI